MGGRTADERGALGSSAAVPHSPHASQPLTSEATRASATRASATSTAATRAAALEEPNPDDEQEREDTDGEHRPRFPRDVVLAAPSHG